MYKHLNFALFVACLSGAVFANQSVFLLAPIVTAPSALVALQNGTAIYQVLNNSNQNLNKIGLIKLQDGVSFIPNAGDQYCASTFNLAAGAACLIKIQINKGAGNIQGGPKVCFSATRPIYCSQPLNDDQLATQITPGPVSATCEGNISNFNYELSQQLDGTSGGNAYWGPLRNQLPLSPASPNLTGCLATDRSNSTAISWMQDRVIAAEAFWVKQKLNYCHHYVPDWQTSAVINGVSRDQLVNTTYAATPGGQCSAFNDIMPGTIYYNQPVRWNYSGRGSETSDNWINNNLRWYGVDCSDFTSFIYNFAFGIQMNSDTGKQGGQGAGQELLFPNTQTSGNTLVQSSNSDYFSPAGKLLCADGSIETTTGANKYCGGFGNDGYFSAYTHTVDPSNPKPESGAITDAMLGYLQTGDLIYLTFEDKHNNGTDPASVVKHVITWTGKKIGYGANDINPVLIAPQTFPCPANVWKPIIGAWVIIDSTYQGPDYRMFSDCPYRNNIWGVRRVIGYMH